MATIQNDRDVLLQAASTRVVTVSLPTNVRLPANQLGAGSIPSSVTTPNGQTFGSFANKNNVNLSNPGDITGQLAMANITGYGALALLSSVDANTQVNNLGNLAYVNQLFANQIGAGTLAAGVIYAGAISAQDFSGKTFTGGSFVGSSFATASSGPRVEMYNSGTYSNQFALYNSSNQLDVLFRGFEGSHISGSTSATSQRILRVENFSTSANQVAMEISTSSSTGIALVTGLKSSVPTTYPSGGFMIHSTEGPLWCNGSVWMRVRDNTPIL